MSNNSIHTFILLLQKTVYIPENSQSLERYLFFHFLFFPSCKNDCCTFSNQWFKSLPYETSDNKDLGLLGQTQQVPQTLNAQSC